MKQNKKGMGLVMAIMIVTMLLIMATGFFTFTTNANRSVQNQVDKVKLYWAAESGSNFSVSWWSDQVVNTRIRWPYFYQPEASKVRFSVVDENVPNIGDQKGKPDQVIIDPTPWNDYNLEDGTNADGTGGSAWSTTVDGVYHEINGHLASLDNSSVLGNLPSSCSGIATNDELYLHPSSEILNLQYPNSNETYTLYLLRYKGERKDDEFRAVWVMDTWAVDDKTGSTYRIVLSDMHNSIETTTGWLQYNEGMVHTQYAETNGRKGVYKSYDFRFGQSYFAEQVRFDYMSGSDKQGPTFYGRIQSSAGTASQYGTGGNTNPFITDSNVEHGVYAEGAGDEAESIKQINASVRGGWEEVDSMSVTDIVWDWDTVAEESNTTADGIYMLNPKRGYVAGSTIQIKLFTTDLTPLNTLDNRWETFAEISAANTVVEKKVPVSSSGITAIAVDSTYSTVSIYGSSSDNFSLITQQSCVEVTEDLYLKELESVRTLYGTYTDTKLLSPTMDMMSKLYEAMYLKDIQGNLVADSHLSIISGLGLVNTESVSDLTGIQADGKRGNQIDLTKLKDYGVLFTTCGYFLGFGDIGTPSSNASVRLYNIGSFIMNQQQEVTGSNSFKGTIAFVQDKRFYDEDFGSGVGWGSGPSEINGTSNGLNDDYRWTGGPAGTNSINQEQFVTLMKVEVVVDDDTGTNK
ncbi:MAG: hypothetical protein PF574_05815 [Candidatus Delongbacteria bacterium]|jgi:hypothetical protein|nr:hypothetical protein [Candidatus Delongbacteria bacterium]